MTAPELQGVGAAFEALLAVARDMDRPPPLDAAQWDALPALARAQRMQGLLHCAITRCAEWSPPAHVRQAVAADARAVAQQSLSQVALLRAIGEAAAARGIRWLPYKGPVLSFVAYGDLAVRPSVDVDILVPREQARDMAMLLGTMGFAPASGLPVDVHHRAYAHLGASPWRNATSLLELHWRLCELGLPWTIGADDLLSRSVTVRMADRTMAVPSADDLLLMLAWHGARHAWEQLEWLACVAALTRDRATDWDALAARGGALGGGRAVRLMQGLLACWLDAAPAPRAAPWLDEARQLIGAQYVRGTTLFAHDRARYRHLLRLLLERRADRVRLWGAQLLLPTEIEARWVALPAPLWPLYVPLRLMRLTLRAAGRAPREATG